MTIFWEILLALEVYCILVSCILVYGLVIARRQPTTRLFIGIVLLNLVGLVSDIAYYVLDDIPGYGVYAVLKVGDLLNHVAAVAILIGLAQFLWMYVANKNPAYRADRKYMVLMWALSGAAILFLAVGACLNWFSYFDGRNRYHATELFGLSVLPPFFPLICFAWLYHRYRKCFNLREHISFSIVCVVFPTACVLLQLIDPNLTVVYIFTLVILLILYLNVYSEQARTLREKELEISRNKAGAVFSQIRPDFLYDVLARLQSLCLTDPAGAKSAVLTFTKHLHVRLDAVALRVLIPFDEELAHVEGYLAFERIRLDAPIPVRYGLHATPFLLPTLTVQSIVEEMVRISPDPQGLVIVIVSNETDTQYSVCVSGSATDGQRLSMLQNSLSSQCKGGVISKTGGAENAMVIIQIPKVRRQMKGSEAL